MYHELEDNFASNTLELYSLTKHTKSETEQLYPFWDVNDVPELHWCGHYYDENKKVIPDGANCCFWHWIGLPQRWEKRHPAYPYQENIFKEYFQDKEKFFYIGKTPKIGASQTWLQIAIHQAIKNPKWRNGQVAIVVGTGGNEAEKMIDRAKELLSYKDERGIPLREENGDLITKLPINEDYNTKKEFSLNSVEFRAYPANNVDSIRSKPNMVLIIVDEIGFFTMVEQQTVRDAFEHYIGNSNAVIALITTAGKAASGVAYEIETEDPSIYKHHLLDYTIGLEPHKESNTTLYDKDELKKLEHSSSWTRNYLRVWGHGSGNIFNSNTIDLISTDYYPLDDIRNLNNILSLDPAYGKKLSKTSSKFAGVGMWKQAGHYYVRSWFELEAPTDDEALQRVREEITNFGYTNVNVDAAWPGITGSIQKIPGVSAYGIAYNQYGLDMIDNAAQQVHDMKLHLHPTHQELKNQLKSVRRGDNGLPDKTLSRFDAGDCISQALWHFKSHDTGGFRKLKGRF